MSSPLISIVVPTHNRPKDVTEAVGTLVAQDYPNFEVVVIANNCTDDTSAAVNALADAHSVVRVVAEPTPGVGAAHNRGVAEAQGELVAFLDDDELAPPGWLSSLYSAQQDTGAGGVGGPYQPLWLTTPPKWLANSLCMQETLSFMDFGHERCKVEWLLGGNMMYTHKALDDAEGFGPWDSYKKANSMVGGGDIVVGGRVRKAGYEVWFEPSAFVWHKVSPSRMRLSYILRRAFWAGYTDVAIGREWKLGDKAGKALCRGWDAVALGAVILPGTLWGRLMVRLGYLHPLQVND